MAFIVTETYHTVVILYLGLFLDYDIHSELHAVYSITATVLFLLEVSHFTFFVMPLEII
jgi:hypothetical protein